MIIRHRVIIALVIVLLGTRGWQTLTVRCPPANLPHEQQLAADRKLAKDWSSDVGGKQLRRAAFLSSRKQHTQHTGVTCNHRRAFVVLWLPKHVAAAAGIPKSKARAYFRVTSSSVLQIFSRPSKMASATAFLFVPLCLLPSSLLTVPAAALLPFPYHTVNLFLSQGIIHRQRLNATCYLSFLHPRHDQVWVPRS